MNNLFCFAAQRGLLSESRNITPSILADSHKKPNIASSALANVHKNLIDASPVFADASTIH